MTETDLANRIYRAIKPSPMCRDCADHGPRCPNTGELCDPTECAKELSEAVRKLQQERNKYYALWLELRQEQSEVSDD